MSKKKKASPAPEKPTRQNRKLEHMGYIIVQSAYNHHVMIGKGGKAVLHAHCTEPKTDQELREMVEECHRLRTN